MSAMTRPSETADSSSASGRLVLEPAIAPAGPTCRRLLITGKRCAIPLVESRLVRGYYAHAETPLSRHYPRPWRLDEAES
jgi:hypothetical protein